ncbi:MAG: hypothetical protein ACUVV6_08595 [Thermoplasmatota archaeon]
MGAVRAVAALALICIICFLAVPTGAPESGTPAGRTADSNNTLETATPLTTAGFLSEGLDPLDDPADFYFLEAEAGRIISASIYIIDYDEQDPGRVNLDLILLNPKGEEVVASRSSYRYDSFRALAVMGGRHYLKVQLAPGSLASGYTLDYSVGEAQIIQDGQEIHGYLTNSSNRNSDWYRVNLTGGASPQRFVATMHEDATARFDLYFMDLWQGYSFWYDVSWWGDPDERVEAVATYSGWYYLQVNAYEGYGSYVLTALVAPATGDGDSEPQRATGVPYNSSYNGQVDQALDHYDWYRFDAAAGETVRASMRLEPQPTDMFALSLLSSDLATIDSRTNYVPGSPPALAQTVTLTDTLPVAGTYYIVVMAKVALKPSIQDLSDENARSDYRLSVELSLHAPPPANRPPEALAPGLSVEFDRNTVYALNLSSLFKDPDGDALRYSASGMSAVRVTFVAPDGALLSPERNWYGRENLTLTASDPYDARASAWLEVVVRRVALPPEIASLIPPAGNITGVNGSGINFVVEASDPEGMPLSYEWSAGGQRLPNTTASIVWTVPADGGVVELSVTVSNGQLSTAARWNVTCLPRPALQVYIIAPENNTRVRCGDRVLFYAAIPGVSAREQTEYCFTWRIGGRVVSEEAQFFKSNLPAGRHRVTVQAARADDSSRFALAEVFIVVEGEEEVGGSVLLYAASAAAGALGVLAGLIVYRARARRRALEELEDRMRESAGGERRRAGGAPKRGRGRRDARRSGARRKAP